MEPIQPTGQGYSPPDTSFDPNTPELDAIAKEKTQRLLQRGLSWIASGVAIMGLSFAIQFLLFQSDDRSFIVPMYVLTSLGALCVLKGMIDIVGF